MDTIRTPIRGLALACVLALGAGPALAAPPDIDKVNGSIRTEAGAAYGSLDTVNGSIAVARDARVQRAETVNGSIKVESGAELGEAETINGAIRIAETVRVRGDVDTVNGAISVASGSRIGGALETVNGGITVLGAEVQGGLTTVNGDLRLDAGATVRGGLRVEPVKRLWLDLRGSSRVPRVVVGRDSVVEGALVFEREVQLFVHDSARIGPVQGAAPVRFSGDAP